MPMVANGTQPQQTPQADIITSASFFPSVSAAAVRAVLRTDSSVTDARLIEAIQAAIIDVNQDLTPLIFSGYYQSLAQVRPQVINTKTEAEILYFRAVSSAVGAYICEQYRNYDSTGTALKKAEEQTDTINEYRRAQRFAIRDLLGQPRVTVELI